MNIVVSGYYGFGNFGDELILEALSQRLDRSHRLTVLSADPAATAALQGLPAIPRWHPWLVWNAIRRADWFISGGGGLLQSATSERSAWYYLELIDTARRLGVPAAVWQQGIGPLTPGLLQRTAAVLSGAAHVSVRDPHSYGLLLGAGLSASRVSLGGDPAWRVSWPKMTAAEARRFMGWESYPRPIVGIAARPLAHLPAQAQASQTACRAFAASHAGTIVWMSAHPQMDDSLNTLQISDFRLPMGEPNQKSKIQHQQSERVVSLLPPLRGCVAIQALDGLVTMRYHPLLIALRTGVPAVAWPADLKLSALLEDLSLPRQLLESGAIPPFSDWVAYPTDLNRRLKLIADRITDPIES